MGQLLRYTCYLCFRNMLALDIELCMELLRSREFELNGFINYAYMVDRMELPQHHEVTYMCRTGDVNVAEQVTCEHHSNNGYKCKIQQDPGSRGLKNQPKVYAVLKSRIKYRNENFSPRESQSETADRSTEHSISATFCFFYF